ncbi:hypothetical protein BGZ63DRAFT_380310 [Mariannaea sp. PMI_226]|nr:hypothetical protein BGZ63DRAFT_380310 [Mariannaea sp. PMI_226]
MAAFRRPEAKFTYRVSKVDLWRIIMRAAGLFVYLSGVADIRWSELMARTKAKSSQRRANKELIERME